MIFSPAEFVRSRPALYGRAVATKDLVWQARVAARAARSAPVVLEDEFGIRLLVEPWQRKSARHLLRRPGDRPAFEVMKAVVPVGGTVFDVGANAGVYSVHAGWLVGPGGHVHAFEPVPATGDRLTQTLALNGVLDRVTVVRSAVTDYSGTAEMNVFDSPEQNGWNSLGLHAMRTYGGEEIMPATQVVTPAVTLDDYCEKNEIDYVDFLKVDVEGFEQNVFAGADRMLKAERVGTVCFELSEDPLVGEGISPAEVLSGLLDRGYKVFRTNPRGGLPAEIADAWVEARRLSASTTRPYVENYFAKSTGW